MLFNSIAFIIFFPAVFLIYWLTPNKKCRFQNIILLLSSYVFYGWWDWRFLSLIAFSSIVDYLIGLAIVSKKRKKSFLILSVVINLGLLGVFKYFNFFIDSWINLWSLLGYEMSISTVNIILPVGISFYTFQTMSYTIDIYRGRMLPTKDFIAFATYISLFPQLVAGPIERASNLLPQILNRRSWDNNLFKEGILQISVGFFRKVIVADNIGTLIDGVYNNPEIYNSSTLIIAILLYSFQIYFDFSGYSDIAIGTAKLLGFRFMQNFNLPYFSSSITEFWRRWHISLSTWLRDYLYIPLGGNREGITKQYRNLFLTMLLGGLWHGSSWNFVVWGAIHGIFLSVEKWMNLVPVNYRLINNILVFISVSLVWIFFRSISFEDSALIFQKIFSLDYGEPFIGNIMIFTTALYGLFLALSFDIYLFVKGVTLEKLGSVISDIKLVCIVTFITVNIILFHSSANNFIYFQF